MSSPPWEVDRQLTVEDARRLVATSFPALDTSEFRHIGSGWEFDAYRTADDFVIRFPRRAHCAELFKPEARVHQLVRRVLPSTIAVPMVEITGSPAFGFPYCFAAHRFIPGIPADALDPSLRPTLTQDLGGALTAIHSILEHEARAAGVDQRNSDEEAGRRFFKHIVGVASGLRGRDPVVDEALDWLGQLPFPFPAVELPPFEGPRRFHHGDLGPEHVLVDPETGRVSGILDWTDAQLGDPARDFAELRARAGSTFADDVLACYHHPLDESFHQRLSFLARWLSLMWLALTHERRLDVSSAIEGVRNAHQPR